MILVSTTQYFTIEFGLAKKGIVFLFIVIAFVGKAQVFNGTAPIGIKENLAVNDAIRIFPVPGSDVLRLDLGNVKLKNIRMTDMIGKEVFAWVCENEQIVLISIYDRDRGTYILKLESETQTITKTFIKN
jgi:hypothetical protein